MNSSNQTHSLFKSFSTAQPMSQENLTLTSFAERSVSLQAVKESVTIGSIYAGLKKRCDETLDFLLQKAKLSETPFKDLTFAIHQPEEDFSVELKKIITKKIRKYGGIISISVSKTSNIVIIDDEVTALAQYYAETKLQDRQSQQISSYEDKPMSSTGAYSRPQNFGGLSMQQRCGVQPVLNYQRYGGAQYFGHPNSGFESATGNFTSGNQNFFSKRYRYPPLPSFSTQTSFLSGQKHQIGGQYSELMKLLNDEVLLEIAQAGSTRKVVSFTGYNTVIEWIKSQKQQWYIQRDITRKLGQVCNQNQVQSVFALATRSKGARSNYECVFHQFDTITNEDGTVVVDLPKYQPNAPRGTALFQTTTEAQSLEPQREQLEKLYDLKVQHMQHKKPKIQDMNAQNLDILEDPVPEHKFCNACNDSFGCFKTHISSMLHRHNSIQQNQQYYKEIDTIFEDLKKKNSASVEDYLNQKQRDLESLCNKILTKSPSKPTVTVYDQSLSKSSDSLEVNNSDEENDESNSLMLETNEVVRSSVQNSQTVEKQDSSCSQQNISQSQDQIYETPQDSTSQAVGPSFMNAFSSQKLKSQTSTYILQDNSMQALMINQLPSQIKINQILASSQQYSQSLYSSIRQDNQKQMLQQSQNTNQQSKYSNTRTPLHRQKILLGNKRIRETCEIDQRPFKRTQNIEEEKRSEDVSASRKVGDTYEQHSNISGSLSRNRSLSYNTKSIARHQRNNSSNSSKIGHNYSQQYMSHHSQSIIANECHIEITSPEYSNSQSLLQGASAFQKLSV